MESTQTKRSSPVKTIVFGLLIGILLTCLSIIITSKKTHFIPCDYSGRSTNTVDRGAPIAYFKVTPSESTCVSVDYTGAVFASDVGNDISFKAFFADLAIWSVVGISGVAAAKNLVKKKH